MDQNYMLKKTVDRFGNKVLELVPVTAGAYTGGVPQSMHARESINIPSPSEREAFESAVAEIAKSPYIVNPANPWVTRRLMRDLKEINTNTEFRHQFSAVPTNNNLMTWHANIRGAEGSPYGNMIFHLVLDFPSNYPVSPPHVRFCNYISHPNVFSSYICLDMLEDGHWASEEEKKLLYTGWSSAYTVSSILLQLQEFFSSKGRSTGVATALLNQKSFTCTCKHNSHSNIYPPIFPRPKSLKPPPTSKGDIFLNINNNVKTEDLSIPVTVKHQQGEPLPVISTAISLRFQKSSLSFDTSRLKISKSKTTSGFLFTFSDFTHPSDGWNQHYSLPNQYCIARSDTALLSLHLRGDIVHFFTFSVPLQLHERKKFPNGDVTVLQKDSHQNIFCGEFSEKGGNYFLKKIKIYLSQFNLNLTNASALVGACHTSVASSDSMLAAWNEELDYGLGSFFSFVPNEIIYMIFEYVEEMDLKCISMTSRAFKKLSLDPLFWSTAVRAHSIRCFHTKNSFKKDIIGFGINFQKYPNSNMISSISSPLDMLSFTAYSKLNVRKSVWKEPFTHWLPLFINRKHGLRAVPIAKGMLASIFNTNYFVPEFALTIFPKLMNTMVVTIMDGSLHASIKALEGYCHFHRMLLHFVEEYPTLLQQVNETIYNFIHDPNCRTKKVVPNLGDFLPFLAVTDMFSWEDIREAYLLECFDRNVKWIIQKHPNLKITSSASDNSIQNRINKTFEATLVSQRLLMFNIYFLRHIAKPAGKTVAYIKSMYDTLYGVPTHALKENLQSAIKDIFKVDSWTKFFDRIDIPLPTTKQLHQWLCDSVARSEMKRYHYRNPPPDKPKPKKPARASLQHDPNDKYYNY